MDAKLDSAITTLTKDMEKLLQNTEGVVTETRMEKYVDERIKVKTADLRRFKSNVVKAGWAIIPPLIILLATNILLQYVLK